MAWVARSGRMGPTGASSSLQRVFKDTGRVEDEMREAVLHFMFEGLGAQTAIT